MLGVLVVAQRQHAVIVRPLRQVAVGHRHAEAERKRRARLIQAEGELQASEELAAAAAVLDRHPQALPLRYLDTLTVVATDDDSTIAFPLPIDLVGPWLEAAIAKA